LLRADEEIAEEHNCCGAECLLLADFVAEVRCKLFWPVIPSL
jgi:hypothetical protein